MAEFYRVGLGPGRNAFYDPITGLHLTRSNPVGILPAGVDLTNIYIALNFKPVPQLIDLDGTIPPKNVEPVEQEKEEEVKAQSVEVEVDTEETEDVKEDKRKKKKK